MMVPRFVRFYSYRVQDCLQEYARTFFAMVNAMYRIEGDESLNQMTVISGAMSGESSVQEHFKKQSKGLHGIVEEVRTVRGR